MMKGRTHRSFVSLCWRLILIWNVAVQVQAQGENEATQQQQHQSKDGDDLVVAKQFLDSGIHSRDVGNIAGAISSLHKAILLYQKNALKIANTDVLADAYYNLAETYAMSKKNEQSVLYYREALDIYAQLDDQSAKLRWAYCLNRLGVILVENFSIAQPEKIQGLLQNAVHGDWNDEEVMQNVMAQMDLSIPKQAVAYFDDAAKVFRAFLQEKGNDREIQQGLATSLQNTAAASTTLGHIQKAIDALEESIKIYEALLKEEVERDVAQGMAEAFYSMSDLYLQQGAYEMAKDRYRRSSKYVDLHMTLLISVDFQWTALRILVSLRYKRTRVWAILTGRNSSQNLKVL